MLKRLIFVSISLLFSLSVFAAAAGKGALQKVTKKYRATKLVEMKVEKSVKSELLGKETKYDGKIFMASGKFRWENFTPEKTLLVFDGKTIWSEQSPPAEFGGPVQVAKGKVDKKTRSNILISSLFDGEVQKNFQVLSEKKDGDVITMEVKPLHDDLTVKNLNIVVDTKENILKQVSYKDDIGNVTTMNFTDVKFLAKEKKNLFKYQPPKDAQVTEL